MDTGRDLACPALWQESLERSLARRGRPTRSSAELFHLRAERDLSRPELLRESLMYSHLRRSAATRRPSMAVPGAGGISALALLAVTTLPGLLGGRSSGHEGAGLRADASDATTARLANAPVAGLAADPKLATKATPVPVAPAPTAAASAPAEPAHVVAARTVEPPRAAAPSSPHSSTSAPHHIALAHDAAARGASRTVAHALSGGAAPAAPKLAARAPRVPAEPQPIGHPSTGGGAIEAASHTKTPAGSPQTPAATPRTPTRTPQTSTRTPRTPATPQAPATPKVPAHSGGTATSHPKTSTHPVAAAKPVSTASR